MDIRLKKIIDELTKLDTKDNSLNQYKYGEDYVEFFHTHQNKDKHMQNVIKMVDEMIEPYEDKVIVCTSNKELFDKIQSSILTNDSSVSDKVVGVKLVDEIYSTKQGNIDVVYGGIVWAMLECGKTKLVFLEDYL